MKIIGIIPARMASSRFPGKPLAKIHGVPMIGHCYKRTNMSGLLDECYVATPDHEICEFIESIDGKVVMTSHSHEMCNDRVVEAVNIIENEKQTKFDIVVNIQGDLPMIFPEMVDKLITPIIQDEHVQTTTMMEEVKTLEEFLDPNRVKVVFDLSNNAVLLTREPVPSRHKFNGDYKKYKHVAIRAYERNLFSEIEKLPMSPMEKIEGIILSKKEADSRNIRSSEYTKIAQNWLNTFVELHQIDYNKIGLNDLGKPKGYVKRQVRNWSKQYLIAATEEIPESYKIMDWLEKNQPKKYNYSLIHNDYKYDNIVFSDDSWNKIQAILDWEMCTLGDPLMDFGTSLAYWTMASDHIKILDGLNYPTAKPGNPGRMELVDMYGEKRGIKIDNLVFYYVFGLFKIAVIVQQIFYRYNKGLTTNKKFKDLNKMSKLMCIIGWQAIQKNRIENLF